MPNLSKKLAIYHKKSKLFSTNKIGTKQQSLGAVKRVVGGWVEGLKKP